MSLSKTPRTSEPYEIDPRSGKLRECREIFKQRRRVVEEMFERHGIFPPDVQVDNLMVRFILKIKTELNTTLCLVSSNSHILFFTERLQIFVRVEIIS